MGPGHEGGDIAVFHPTLWPGPLGGTPYLPKPPATVPPGLGVRASMQVGAGLAWGWGAVALQATHL